MIKGILRWFGNLDRSDKKLQTMDMNIEAVVTGTKPDYK